MRNRGVFIHNNTLFAGVYFSGDAIIEPYCRIFGDPKITIGSGFYMNSGCHILGNITIGDNVLIGPKVVIWGRDHGMEIGMPMKNQAHLKQDIIIKNDVWIAANVTILKGITIGEGAVVGAGAVVTKNIPKYAIVGGNPARVIKYRKE